MSVQINRRVTTLAMIGVIAIVLVMGIPMAQSALQTADQTFTGCLKNGKLEEVAIGDAPLNPCDSNETQVG